MSYAEIKRLAWIFENRMPQTVIATLPREIKGGEREREIIEFIIVKQWAETS